MVCFTSCVTSTSILGTRVMEYAHSKGSSSVKLVASSSSSSLLLSVAPGSALGAYLPVCSACANNHPASCPNPWASLVVWVNGEGLSIFTASTTSLCRRSALVGEEGVLSQQHVQLLMIPRAHNVCEYSFGNQHCPQWINLNSWELGSSALDEAVNAI